MQNHLHQNQALKIENISLLYGTHKALDDISLTINSGSLTALIGPNGAGKSSIVKAICGRVALQTGSVLINGHEASTPQARHNLGVAPQQAALYNYLTAEENLLCFAKQSGMHQAEAKTHAERIMSMIGMTKHASTLAANMSGGMRQRVNIGAAIIHSPKLIILDEPAAGLDPQGIHQVNLLIKKLKEEGFAILLITHDMQQASLLADEVVILSNGQIKASGSQQNVIQELCEQTTTITVKTMHKEKLSKIGFSEDSSAPDHLLKIMKNREEAINQLSALQSMNIPIENCTISTPGLGNALDAAIDNTGKSVS